MLSIRFESPAQGTLTLAQVQYQKVVPGGPTEWAECAPAAGQAGVSSLDCRF